MWRQSSEETTFRIAISQALGMTWDDHDVHVALVTQVGVGLCVLWNHPNQSILESDWSGLHKNSRAAQILCRKLTELPEQFQ